MDYFRVDPAHTDEAFKEAHLPEKPVVVMIEKNGVVITLEQAGKKIYIDFKDLEELICVLELAQHTSCTIMKELLDTPFISAELRKIRDERQLESFGKMRRPHFNLNDEV